MADISADGPFSSFPGIERWFAVVVGKGVVLGLDGKERRVLPGDPPLRFDGAAAPSCRLIDGPTRDLNLMVRGGAGGMRAATESSWQDDSPLRALFAAGPGQWSNGKESRDVAAHTLVWDDVAAGESWTFVPRTPKSAGWWLRFAT